MRNLLDINGNAIFTNKWYKIMLSDGSELGFGVSLDGGKYGCAPVPSGQGLVIRYRRHQNDDLTIYGWPIGDCGYFKGYTVTPDGGQVLIKHLSLSNGSPPLLAWYDSDDSYGFVAKQLPGNRVALYAFDQNKAVAGLKVQNVGQGLSMHGVQGAYPIALDCAFVEVGPYDTANIYF
ncbi:uncharacterized protein LAESUDRAFT_684892 [Laetiporus sulphureus 93-53]|uniref:Uncharacterized protein n=1 Tax=Laetiporus sulphureus 93-53 TaxID=1314785 RepID=A0A165CES0_9APHY|nr:uncharacterized protein LAESUDRAFT_684892 [Laetiporus sulphureus 93-53]KZT02681.1 hypothetical protein LAESUDRAFT_684892 [Laetiporus sulphureus 93-53]